MHGDMYDANQFLYFLVQQPPLSVEYVLYFALAGNIGHEVENA